MSILLLGDFASGFRAREVKTVSHAEILHRVLARVGQGWSVNEVLRHIVKDEELKDELLEQFVLAEQQVADQRRQEAADRAESNGEG